MQYISHYSSVHTVQLKPTGMILHNIKVSVSTRIHGWRFGHPARRGDGW